MVSLRNWRLLFRDADLQHHQWLLMLGGKLYLAPLPVGPLEVLDIGTGTGIWAKQFAKNRPETTV